MTAVILLALGCVLYAVQAEAKSKPNIVFVYVDDMRRDELMMVGGLRIQLVNKGTTFTNYYATTSLCCPSRATALTGRYAHNHGVKTNLAPDGSYYRFKANGHTQNNLAVWANRAGYKTWFGGKLMQGWTYKEAIPPGWDHFEAGQHPARDPILGAHAADFVRKSSGDPMFVALWMKSPHEPYEPGPKYAGTRKDNFARTPAYDEDVSDKPDWLSSAKSLTDAEHAEITDRRRKRLELLSGASEGLQKVITALKVSGELDNTYIVFASDNGITMGERRLMEMKNMPYEESSHVPLVIRGPGIKVGREDALVGNQDLAPTMAQLMGARATTPMDGRSLVSMLRGASEESLGWRNSILLEGWPIADWFPPYSAMRTKDSLYVEWDTGEKELYDTAKDPYEVNNIYPDADAATATKLSKQLESMKTCAGGISCRVAEDLP